MKSSASKMKIDVWSDIMCPFCYIGKRHFEAAVSQFAHKAEVELVWHSFQLDPTIPTNIDQPQSVFEYLADRKGISLEQSVKMHESVLQMAAKAGLDFHLDKAVVANSFKAHRLIQLAKSKGLGDEAEELLFSAYFVEGKDLGDSAVLEEIGKGIGLETEVIQPALTSDDYGYLVSQDIQEAQSLGIRGVPFFIFHRKYAVSGAQPIEIFLQTLIKSHAEWQQLSPFSNLRVAGK